MWAQAGFDVLWNTIPELHGRVLHAVSTLAVWRAMRHRTRIWLTWSGCSWVQSGQFDYFTAFQHGRLSKYYAWAQLGNESQIRSDSACLLSAHRECVQTSQRSVLTTLRKSVCVCVCLCVYGLSCVLKDQRLWGREDIFILVNLCLIPLCPLSSCHIPNSFMGMALLRLIAMSESCPGLAYQQSCGHQPSAQWGQGLGLTFEDNP